MSKLFFEDIVFINGVKVSGYSLEEGESIDVFFPSTGLSSSVYHINGTPEGKGLKIFFDGSRYYVLPEKEKRNYEVYQKELSDINNNILVSVFFDGEYCLVLNVGDDSAVFVLKGRPEMIECELCGYERFYFKYTAEIDHLLVFDETTLRCVFDTFGNVKVGREIDREYFVDDLLRRHITQKFAFSDDGVVKLTENVECTRVQSFIEELYPILLLQAVMCKDANVRTYLTDDLAPDIPALFDFFGEIRSIDVLSKNIFKAYTENDVKLYAFHFANGLISDVIEL